MKGKASFKIISAVLCIALLLAAFLYFNNDIGIPKSKIERDIRSSQNIKDSYLTVGDIQDEMAAFISYDKDKSDHIFSVYVNYPYLSFGYFFRGGGSLSIIDRNIASFTLENCSQQAFISMNKQKVNMMEIDDGNSVKKKEIESDKPFAVVLPVNAGIITFYDENGNEVEYIKQRL